MGLIQALLSALFGRSGGGMLRRLMGGPMLAVVVAMLTRRGGLGSLLDKFKGAGLGQQADSWVSTGDNEPIDGEELERALGPEELQKIAEKTGMSVDEVREKLAAGLPEVVNHLTPKGAVPDDDTLNGMLEKLNRFLPR